MENNRNCRSSPRSRESKLHIRLPSLGLLHWKTSPQKVCLGRPIGLAYRRTYRRTYNRDSALKRCTQKSHML